MNMQYLHIFRMRAKVQFLKSTEVAACVLNQISSIIWCRSSDKQLTRSCCKHCQNPSKDSKACHSCDTQLHGYGLRCSRGSLQKLTGGSGR